MDASRRLTFLTRIGFATRGVLYLVIAMLVVRAGRAEDPSGALQYLGHGGGLVLLWIMAAGLLGYGIWRMADAVLDIERHGSGRKAIVERIGAGLSGAVHLFLAWQAFRLTQGIASSGNGAVDGARVALDLPGGSMIVLLGAVALFGIGIIQLVKAAKGSFLRHLEPQVAARPWAQWSGRAGYAARGVVFLISGAFLFKAASESQASEAGGMADVLSWLSSPLDLIVAAGLFGFGVFSLIEARFRVLQDVPVEGIVRRAAKLR